MNLRAEPWLKGRRFPEGDGRLSKPMRATGRDNHGRRPEWGWLGCGGRPERVKTDRGEHVCLSSTRSSGPRGGSRRGEAGLGETPRDGRACGESDGRRERRVRRRVRATAATVAQGTAVTVIFKRLRRARHRRHHLIGPCKKPTE